MKLNETQIHTIDDVLVKLGVVYIDYKFEILDHMATQVEELMAETDLDFEQAFKVILKKWEPKLKKSSSGSLGYWWELPEIVLQKAKKIYWRKMILLVVLSFLLMGVLLLLKSYLTEMTKPICYLLFSAFAIQLIGYVKIIASKHKTTFSFLYKQQVFAFLLSYFLPIHCLIVNQGLLGKSDYEVFPFLFMVAMLSISPIMNLRHYNQHFKELRRNKKFA